MMDKGPDRLAPQLHDCLYDEAHLHEGIPSPMSMRKAESALVPLDASFPEQIVTVRCIPPQGPSCTISSTITSTPRY